VYEGCPKAFDATIWWPKTKFGRPAAVNCPKGSIGTAVRHCNDEKGWLPPELFNCTTASFSSLKKMNDDLRRNDSQMTSERSKAIVRLLPAPTAAAIHHRMTSTEDASIGHRAFCPCSGRTYRSSRLPNA
ncbi:hypothetical protein CRUP_014405, partial [Coryphaenoides rupestris]